MSFGIAKTDARLRPESDRRGPKCDPSWCANSGCWTVELVGDIERVRLEAILNDAPDSVLRAKGFIRLRKGGTHVMQMVGRRWSLSPAPEAAAASAVAALVGRAGTDAAAPVDAWLARLTADGSESRRTGIGRELRTEGATAKPTVVKSERDTAA